MESIIIEGLLVRLNIPNDNEKIVSFSLLDKDGEVTPITSILRRNIDNIHDMEMRLKYFMNNKFLGITSDGIKTDFKLDHAVEFNLSGWEFNDESSQESNSGVNFTDSFRYEKGIIEHLTGLLKKEVIIELYYKL